MPNLCKAFLALAEAISFSLLTFTFGVVMATIAIYMSHLGWEGLLILTVIGFVALLFLQSETGVEFGMAASFMSGITVRIIIFYFHAPVGFWLVALALLVGSMYHITRFSYRRPAS